MTGALAIWLLAAAVPAGPGPADPCRSPLARDQPARLYRAGSFLSAHQLALVLRTICPVAESAPDWTLVSALSLLELDDPAGAVALLAEQQPAAQSRLAVALAWVHLRQRDDQAFALALGRLPPLARLRLQALAVVDDPSLFADRARGLPDPLSVAALQAGRALEQAAHTRRPWLAGGLSALLPGAGQVYAGSWSSAAVAFVLNAVMIGATVELARHRLYATAVAAGTVGSVFYVGTIVNAADLAGRRNQTAALPPAAACSNCWPRR